jgi:hypothetical protein
VTEAKARRPRPGVFFIVIVPFLVASCGFLFGSRSASKAERAKIGQLVPPLSQRGVPLKMALAAIVDAAPLPVEIDVCDSLEQMPVTIITTTHVELGVLVRGAAMQAGAPLRLFIGHHGEVAHPTLFCPDDAGTLTTIRKRQS